MAKATKSPAEIKAAKAELKEALKLVNTEHAKFVSDHKAAEKALTVAKKEAEKALKSAQGVVDAAAKKLARATDAADKGRAKIEAKLAELSPATAA